MTSQAAGARALTAKSAGRSEGPSTGHEPTHRSPGDDKTPVQMPKSVGVSMPIGMPSPPADAQQSYPLPPNLDLSDKTVVVTGGTSGMGLETVKTLCLKNARVFMVSDDPEKGQWALGQVRKQVPKARVDFMECDISNMAAVRNFANEFKAKGLPLHVLVMDAGQFIWPYAKTPEGFERTLAVNYLGHFYMAHLLLPEVKAAAPSRIVWQASAFEQLGVPDWDDLGGEFARDSGVLQYSQSKLYSLMAVKDMAKRLKGSGVEVFATEPGLVNTQLYDRQVPTKFWSWLFTIAARIIGQSPRRGSYSLTYAAASPEVAGKSGAFFGPPYLGFIAPNLLNLSRLVPINPNARNEEKCRRLYEETAKLLEAKIGEPFPNKLPPTFSEEFARELAHEKQVGAQADSRAAARPARNAIAYAQKQANNRNKNQN